MNKMKFVFVLASMMLLFITCNNNYQEKIHNIVSIGNDTIDLAEEHILNTDILTKEQQQTLTPGAVLDILKEGNKEYVDDKLTIRNNSERIKEASEGQYPKAVILSCLDSRVPVEDVFHRGIGDVFVARVAGNITNADILGSIEYGCKVSGAKLVVVLGHEYCGAVKSAIDGVVLGNITGILSKIEPAVIQAKEGAIGDTSSKNATFVDAVSHQNVRLTIDQIRKDSPILKEMEQKGEIKIVGAMYDMETGEVDFFERS